MLDLPVGYRRFHPVDAVNYQLNRWLATADEKEFSDAAAKVRGLDDWKREFLTLGELAANEGRDLHASTYFRAAEFFMSFSDTDKLPTYEKYRKHFDVAARSLEREECDVPYGDASLPAVRFPAKGKKRDTIVFHGGFDSYMEEFFVFGPEFARLGYEFIVFEGPGQGAALRRGGLTMSSEWEHPVAAILDHFKVTACTLIGVSLGGYLAPRAAAYDTRIQRVVMWNMLYDFLDCFAQSVGRHTVNRFMRLMAEGKQSEVDAQLTTLTLINEGLGWAIRHGMHISGSKSPSDYLLWTASISTAAFSERLTQDILVLAGAEDHIVPLSQMTKQLEALKAARSVTVRLFTAADHAHNHCQIGNKALAFDVMEGWLSLVLKPQRAIGNGRDYQREGFASATATKP